MVLTQVPHANKVTAPIGFQILELVEQYNSVCTECVCESTGASREEAGAAIAAVDKVEIATGRCGRCRESSTSVVIATKQLASRFRQVASVPASAGLLPAVCSLGYAVAVPTATMPVWKLLGEAFHRMLKKLAERIRKLLDQRQVTAETLDADRRSLIRKLNVIDPGGPPREMFGKRIDRLQRHGKLPPDVAKAIRQLNRLRNRAVYDNYEPGTEDKEMLKPVYSTLEEWSRVNGLSQIA